MNVKKKLVFYLITIAFLLLILRLFDAAVGKLFGVSEFIMPVASSSYEHISDEYRYSININSLQLRSPEIPLQSKKKRIFVIGDSFVFGTGVEEEDTFTRLSEGILRKRGMDVDFVNLGYVLQSPRTYLKRLRLIKQKLKPDFIVLVLHTNDVIDLERRDEFFVIRNYFENKYKTIKIAHFICPEITDFFLRREFRKLSLQAQSQEKIRDKSHIKKSPGTPSQKPAKTPEKNRDEEKLKYEYFLNTSRHIANLYNIPDSRFQKWAKSNPSIIKRAALGDISSQIVQAALFKPEFYHVCLDIPEDKRYLLEELKSSILDIKAEAEQSGVGFILSYVPSELQYDKDKLLMNRKLGYQVDEKWLTETSNLEKEIETFAARHNIQFKNFTEASRRHASEKIVWDFDLHYNEKGHQVVAPLFADFIEKNFKLSNR